MRCPHCGASNADDAMLCAVCGERLKEPGETISTAEVTEEAVDELMGQLPTVVAERAAEETRLLQERARQNAENTRLMEAETRLLSNIEYEYEDELLDDEEEPEDEADAEAAAEEQLAKTTVRPAQGMGQQPLDNGGRFVVRNTRDYDHDAQSVNTVRSGDQFATISESREERSVWRDPYAKSNRRGRVPGEGNSRSKLRPFLAILLVALVLSGGAAVVSYGLEMWGGKSVPNVMSVTQETAEARLAEKGFVARVEAVPADDNIGLVVSQSPDWGTRLPEGSEIVIEVATNRTVPEVLGKTEDEARALLEEAGAERVVVKSEPSSEPAGTVIAVKPGVGEAFVSHNDVTLILATPFTVPDVIGKKETDAVAAIEQVGYGANVVYITSSQTVRTVVETVPAPGEALAQGSTVEVRVSAPYPSNPYHLAEFFAHSSQDVDTYLQKEGFSFEGGGTASGMAQALYSSSDKGRITFTSTPHSGQLQLSNKENSNVLATGMPFSGVRIDLPSSVAPGGFDLAAVESVAKTCGFEGLTDWANEKSIKLPSGVSRLSVTFACGSGRMGDLVWSVLLINEGSTTRVSATCGKEGLYVPSSMLPNDTVSAYVAYQEVYASQRYASPKEDKKDDKDKKDNKDEKSENDANEAAEEAWDEN